MKFKAVIFDLNGTVLSDEYLYGYAFKRVLVKLGAKVDSDYPHVGGIGVAENWPALLEKYNIKTDKSADELAVMTQNEYRSHINEIELKDGFIEFAQDLKDSDILIALATSNTWDIVDEVLKEFELEEFFDVVTTKEEIDRNKPDPRIFLLTADKLTVETDMCLVFEDSRSGVEAAKNAGMKVVGVARDKKQHKELNKADKIISDFTEVSPKVLNELD